MGVAVAGRVLGRASTALLAGGSLAAGFAVAELTGVRALGGTVLALAVATCALAGWRRTGVVVAAGLTLLYLGLFVASHLMADPLGAWTSVALVSVAMAVVSYAVDRRT